MCVCVQACRHGHVQHLEHLLFYGADMSAQNASGNTALHICALYNQVSASRLSGLWLIFLLFCVLYSVVTPKQYTQQGLFVKCHVSHGSNTRDIHPPPPYLHQQMPPCQSSSAQTSSYWDGWFRSLEPSQFSCKTSKGFSSSALSHWFDIRDDI